MFNVASKVDSDYVDDHLKIGTMTFSFSGEYTPLSDEFPASSQQTEKNRLEVGGKL